MSEIKIQYTKTGRPKKPARLNLPRVPEKPHKTYRQAHSIPLGASSSGITIAALLKLVPEHIKDEDIYIYADAYLEHNGYYDDPYGVGQICACYYTVEQNENYDEQIAVYKSKRDEYTRKKKKWDAEEAQRKVQQAAYDEWMNNQELIQQQKQIKYLEKKIANLKKKAKRT